MSTDLSKVIDARFDSVDAQMVLIREDIDRVRHAVDSVKCTKTDKFESIDKDLASLSSRVDSGNEGKVNFLVKIIAILVGCISVIACGVWGFSHVNTVVADNKKRVDELEKTNVNVVIPRITEIKSRQDNIEGNLLRR